MRQSRERGKNNDFLFLGLTRAVAKGSRALYYGCVVRLKLTQGELPLLTEERMGLILQYGGQDMLDRVKDWYRALPADYFDNPAPFPDGTSRREGQRSFMRGLTNWQLEPDSEGGFTLGFTNPQENGVLYGLRHHEYGSPAEGVKPVKARALTIPLTAKAKGRRADEFEAQTGLELFLVKRHDNPDPELIGTLCWEDEQGALHAAYALRTRSHLAPLKERRGHPAVPTEESLGEFFSNAFLENFMRYA